MPVPPLPTTTTSKQPPPLILQQCMCCPELSHYTWPPSVWNLILINTLLKIHSEEEIKALGEIWGMIKVESQWLCFNSVLFSLTLMGICCKNSSWCNGTAYAKISHKPLQLLSEVFHLVWACSRHFSFTFMHSLCFTHDSEYVTHSVLSLCSHPSFSSPEHSQLFIFGLVLNGNKNSFFSIGIKVILYIFIYF